MTQDTAAPSAVIVTSPLRITAPIIALLASSKSAQEGIICPLLFSRVNTADGRQFCVYTKDVASASRDILFAFHYGELWQSQQSYWSLFSSQSESDGCSIKLMKYIYFGLLGSPGRPTDELAHLRTGNEVGRS